ncbi:MAG: oligosaccharide flippase family protein, partial [Bacteroidota bacterium]
RDFNEPELKVPLIISLLILVPQILSRIFASGVNGFRKIWQSSLVNDTLSTAVVGLGILVLLLLNIEITVINIAILYAIARVTVTATVGLYWRSLFRFKGKRTMQTWPMLKVAVPLLIVSSTALIANNADTIMLGWLGNAREMGLYSVAARLGLLTSFFHLLTVSTLSPKIASLYSDKKRKNYKKWYSK